MMTVVHVMYFGSRSFHPARTGRYLQLHDISAHADLILPGIEADSPVSCLTPLQLSVGIVVGKPPLRCKFYCFPI